MLGVTKVPLDSVIRLWADGGHKGVGLVASRSHSQRVIKKTCQSNCLWDLLSDGVCGARHSSLQELPQTEDSTCSARIPGKICRSSGPPRAFHNFLSRSCGYCFSAAPPPGSPESPYHCLYEVLLCCMLSEMTLMTC